MSGERAVEMYSSLSSPSAKIEGSLRLSSARVAIVATRFNQLVVDPLLAGATDTLTRIGELQPEAITVVRVAGAVELPLICQKLASTNQFDGIIALGSVIRGSTAHFEQVTSESSSGLMQVMLKHQIPIAFGVLATDNIEQALDRAGCKTGNKGTEAALSLLETINVLRNIDEKFLQEQPR